MLFMVIGFEEDDGEGCSHAALISSMDYLWVLRFTVSSLSGVSKGEGKINSGDFYPSADRTITILSWLSDLGSVLPDSFFGHRLVEQGEVT